MVVPGARAAIESLYEDRCTITAKTARGYDGAAYPPRGVTEFDEYVIASDQPCRLSFESLSVSNGDPAAAVAQGVKLFMSPDIAVPAGSDVTVTRQGRTMRFASSGLPAVYSSHQEIPLEQKERFA